MKFREFESVQKAAEALADEVGLALRQGFSARAAASLAVPGGRTPVPFFHALSLLALDWSQVLVTLTDERWVSEADAASNARLVRSELLQQQAQVARFVPLYSGGASAADDAAAASLRLAGMPLPFDAVVLGMGEDGHFASLFPGSPGLVEALNDAVPACVPMQAPAAPEQRLSWNLAALRATRRLMLLVTGATKRDLLMSAAGADPLRLPIAALMQGEPGLEVFWAP